MIVSTVVLLAVIYPLLPNILILLKTPADIMDRALAYTRYLYRFVLRLCFTMRLQAFYVLLAIRKHRYKP